MRPLLVTLVLLVACRSSDTTAADGATDLSPSDTLRAIDGSTSPLSIDFAIEGCPSMEINASTCTGNAPLALRFVPIASLSIAKVQWDFGDGSPIEPDNTPTHTYAIPGRFTLRVIGIGAGGVTVSHTAEDAVIVTANPTGGACQAANQCADGLSCLCSASASCTRGPSFGMCTLNCQQQDCGEEEVCANLVPSTPSVETREAWQGRFCLRSCVRDADCGIPLRCRTLPVFPEQNVWTRGCFGDFPVDIGAPCMDERGSRRDDLCAGGLCAALGSKGLCAKDCKAFPCPSGSQCATFGNGDRLCLRECSVSFRCDQDPLLTCSAPGDGYLGFKLGAESPANSTYCAPKLCGSDDTCGNLGRCLDATNNGHCMAR